MPGSGTNTPYKGTPRFGVPAKMLDATRNVIASIVINFIIFLVIVRLQFNYINLILSCNFSKDLNILNCFLNSVAL